MRHPESLLHRTGQVWKFRLAMIGMAICALMLAGISHVGAHLTPETAALIVLASGVTAVGLLIAAFLGIRCPACGARWFWQAANKTTASWYIWLHTLRECPRCHYDGKDHHDTGSGTP